MAKNEFKPFATANGANVTAQTDYEALPARTSGFQSGKASSAQINKAIRQATVIASVVAQFIANESGDDVLDDGDVAALQQSLLDALKQNAADNLPKASTTVAGITALSSATNSSDETVAATPKAVKAANDNANTRLLATATAAAATKLATARTIGGVSFDGTANINLPGVNATGSQSTTGNAATATKLATARTINGVAFDGSANITVTAAADGGAADTASKLTTARTINGVAFDGSANITITAAANGGTATTATGNAGSATKLATARTINGVAFDGSANITVSDTRLSNIKQLPTAWANFNGVGSVTINDSYNISSIVRESGGIYTINFSTPMANASYAVICGMGDSAYTGDGMATILLSGTSPVKKDINGVRIFGRGGAGVFDISQCSVVIFGGV